MGKKLDALFGRRNTFKAENFKPTVNLAISRLAVLNNHRQARLRQARSDVLQLLQFAHHQRALLRVEHVIKEQNMLDVYDEIEGYFNLLIERVHLIAQQRECPEELQEAASGILYAASRCGEFPEIQQIRAILTSRFGKEFAARAIELRNGCKVNPKIVAKLSTRMPSYESRMKVLKEIANENSIVLHLQPLSSLIPNEEQVTTNKEEQNQQQHNSEINQQENPHNFPNGGNDDEFKDSFKVDKKYKNVADAAQAAFESAAYAAAAARAAMELSRSQSHDPDNDDDNDDDGDNSSRIMLDGNDSLKVMSTLEGKEILTEQVNKNGESLEKPDELYTSNSSDEMVDSLDKEIEIDPIGKKGGPRVVLDEVLGSEEMHSAPFLDLDKKLFSVRTRRVHGY